MAQAPSVLVLNGPNLNMLGIREPTVYGRESLADLERRCRQAGEALGIKIDCRHSNLEGELITWIQKSRGTHVGIVINAGGYSHSSVAIRDALTLCEVPIIEVHITNIYAREGFRHHSVISGVAKGVICGFGIDGYTYAIDAVTKLARNAPTKVRTTKSAKAAYVRKTNRK